MGTKLVTFLCYCVKYKGAKNRMLVKYSQNVRVYILCPIFFARKTILFKGSMRDFIIMILFCSRRIICCRANIYNYQIAKFFVKKHKKMWNNYYLYYRLYWKQAFCYRGVFSKDFLRLKQKLLRVDSYKIRSKRLVYNKVYIRQHKLRVSQENLMIIYEVMKSC